MDRCCIKTAGTAVHAGSHDDRPFAQNRKCSCGKLVRVTFQCLDNGQGPECQVIGYAYA
jgi:hypothetical protein